MLITRKMIKLFIYSELYHYNLNKNDYRIYLQFSTVYSCFKLHSLVTLFIITNVNLKPEPACCCLAKQVLINLSGGS